MGKCDIRGHKGECEIEANDPLVWPLSGSAPKNEEVFDLRVQAAVASSCLLGITFSNLNY